MSKPQQNPTLSAALRDQKERGVKVVTLASAFSVSESTMYETISEGAWDERFADIRHALRTLPESAAGAILGTLLHGTGFLVSCREDRAAGDFDGNGRRDTQDALAGGVLLAEQMAETLRRVHRGASSKTYTGDDGAAAIASIDAVCRTGSRLKTLIGDLVAVPQMKVVG